MKNSKIKIVLTGSIGNIGKPLAQELVQKGHLVTVISSNADKQNEIEAMGANAAIGSIHDITFLTNTFTGADLVYLMEPPVNYFDTGSDIYAYYGTIAESYKQSILNVGVLKVIHLSSIGAHTAEGNGMLRFHYDVENILNQLPNSVSIKFLRPVGFYYNMLAFIPAIKNTGTIVQNYGGDQKEPWVSPLDIAAVIAEEVEKSFDGRTIRYIASDEASPNEIAKILGEAIGQPELRWTVLPDEAFFNNLIRIGFNPQAAKGLTEMNAGRGKTLYEHYNQHKPVLGKVKLADFAQEFAAAYRQRLI